MPERLRGDAFMNVAASALPVRVFRHSLTRPFATHWHDFYELLMVTSGSGTHEINGMPVSLTRGSMALLSPVDFHALIPDQAAPLTLYNIIFRETLLSDALHDLLYAAGRAVCCAAADDVEAAEAECARLDAECAHPADGTDLLIPALLTALLVRIARCASAVPEPARPQAAHHVSVPIRAALRAIDHHFREPITLAAIAARVHLSPNYFSQQFHQQVGMTFQAYVVDKRLRFAAALLRASDIPITEVCAASGFNTIPHFNRAFRRCYGCAPGAYRTC